MAKCLLRNRLRGGAPKKARGKTGENGYVANEKTEWARRVRELRTELGWPVVTKVTGRPDLSVGVYVLEQDRQSPVHDRKIPDPVRAAVLTRDDHRWCRFGESAWCDMISSSNGHRLPFWRDKFLDISLLYG
jgi:hypothetical protein